MSDFNAILNWMDKNKYQYSTKIVLDEKENDGKVKLEIISKNKLFAISLSHKSKIKIFKNQKVADWIVVEFLIDKQINLHLIELKRTITTSSWQKIKEQLKGAYEHSFLLKGLFDYEINEIFCYSAYVYDKLNNINTTNPIFLKNSLGDKSQTSAVDWENNKINIHNLSVFHKKIVLELINDIGTGVYNL
jgi:hypothetical protein